MMMKYAILTSTLFAVTAFTTQSIAQTSEKVPVDVAHRMVANYAPRAGFVERDGEQLPNTRTVWFSVAQLNAFIAEIEDDGGDGIRFYFAAYDDDYSDSSETTHVPPKEYWGYNTLLMVPTRDSTANGTTYHRDYLTILGQGFSGSEQQAKPSTVENRGLLCPPSCGDDPALLND